MHPYDFFNNCSLRTGIDTFETFDNDLKERLKNIHPRNFLKTRITLLVYEVELSYLTSKNNHKTVKRYAIMDSKDEKEYFDFWLDMFIRDYNQNNPNHKMIDAKIDSIEQICDAIMTIE